MKMKRKKVKGMTLIEVIISMLIFTLLATIMVKTGSVTKSLIMNSNHVTNKTTAESPIGSVQDVAELEDAAKSQITTNGGDPNDPAQVEAEIQKTPITIVVSSGGYTATINADKYSTAAAAKQATANGRNSDTSGHLNGDLEFYVIQP